MEKLDELPISHKQELSTQFTATPCRWKTVSIPAKDINQLFDIQTRCRWREEERQNKGKAENTALFLQTQTLSCPCFFFFFVSQMTCHEDKWQLTSSLCSLRISSSFSFSCSSKASSLLGSWATRRHRVIHFASQDSSGGCGGGGSSDLSAQPTTSPTCTGLRGAPACRRGAPTCDSFDCPHKCLCVFASTLCAPMSAARRVLRAIKLSGGPTRDDDLSVSPAEAPGAREGEAL